MKNRVFFVVGEKFREFARNKDVLTIGQLQALTRLPGHLLDTHNVLMLGQGVPQEDVLSIVNGSEASHDATSRFEVSDLMRVMDRAPSNASHKFTPYNTLIGAPRRKGEDTFEVPFNIDERCELMGDHQTGQHMQGMLLVEAFRQSFLAVTETFFPFGQDERYFVINSMNIEFQNFMFPLPAHIDYRIIESDVTVRRARYNTALSAMQNGDQCASAAISFTVYPAEVIAKREAVLAGDVTRKMLASQTTHAGSNGSAATIEAVQTREH